MQLQHLQKKQQLKEYDEDFDLSDMDPNGYEEYYPVRPTWKMVARKGTVSGEKYSFILRSTWFDDGYNDMNDLSYNISEEFYTAHPELEMTYNGYSKSGKWTVVTEYLRGTTPESDDPAMIPKYLATLADVTEKERTSLAKERYREYQDDVEAQYHRTGRYRP